MFFCFFRDLNGRVPFIVAKDKETRNEFRRFMSSYPARFDYRKAQVGTVCIITYIGDYRKFRVVISQTLRHISRQSPTGGYNNDNIIENGGYLFKCC